MPDWTVMPNLTAYLKYNERFCNALFGNSLPSKMLSLKNTFAYDTQHSRNRSDSQMAL